MEDKGQSDITTKVISLHWTFSSKD